MSSDAKDSSKSHTKNKPSLTKASRPRSSTKGPLDVDDDPLSSPASSAPMSPSPAQLSPNPNTTIRRSASKQHPQDPSSPISNIGENRQKDFSFLLRPEIYHPLTPLNVPQAFRGSAKQPNSNSSPEELLAKGHFRAAAIAAVQELTGSSAIGGLDPRNSKRIFDLLYVRLACLTLIEATPLAAQEVKALEDLNSVRTYVDEVTGEHLVPWELRVLNVRLQALGFGDPRRAVMSYHDLAKEARQQITKAASRHDNSATELWKARLHDLGVKVASALIGMDDLSGAAHHLRTLRSRGDGKLELSKALLWLHLGSADDARECAENCIDSKVTEEIIQALCDMAEAEYELALSRWRDLLEGDGKGDEMISVNAAVCLLYLGRIQEGRDILEQLVDSGLSSHTLLFNLCTMYELCTEKNKALKIKLTEKVAGLQESPLGWEKTNADFKL